jgi:hypothetical protein
MENVEVGPESQRRAPRVFGTMESVPSQAAAFKPRRWRRYEGDAGSLTGQHEPWQWAFVVGIVESRWVGVSRSWDIVGSVT